MKRIFLVLWFLLPFLQSNMTGAAENGDGDIYFSTQTPGRPAEGRHAVAPGDKIKVCLKLRSENVALFQKLEQGAIGYRLILEDDKDPPHVLVIAPGNRVELMKRDAEGCFSGDYEIPNTIPSGLYQVADLLFAYHDQSYYSLRDYLFNFSQVDELEVNNPASDTEAPRLVAISKYPHHPLKVKVSKVQLKIKFGQVFKFEETGTGLDRNSLRVRYQVAMDGIVRNFVTAICRARPHQTFNCKVEMVRPLDEWSARNLHLELDSVSIQDKAGNRLVLNDPAEWEAQAQGVATAFDFPPRDYKSTPPERYQLQKDRLY